MPTTLRSDGGFAPLDSGRTRLRYRTKATAGDARRPIGQAAVVAGDAFPTPPSLCSVEGMAGDVDGANRRGGSAPTLRRGLTAVVRPAR
jgi:hypothetical protein